MTTALESTCEEAVQKALSEVLNEPTIVKECVDRASFCNQLLTALKNHNSLAVTIAEVFATLGREEYFRSIAAECGVITALTPLLASTRDVRLQALRAVGNLCFDNDLCRKQLLVSDGCPALAGMVRECSAPLQEPLSSRMKCIICGCLLNVCNNNEELCKEMLGHKVESALIELLAREGEEDEAVLQMALKALNALLSSEAISLDGLVTSPLPKVLYTLLHQLVDQDLDLFDGIHQVLDTLVENESWQVAVVDSSIAEQLLAMVDQEMQKQALDIVVQLLKNDTCMQKLFDAGHLLSKAMKWLSSDDTRPEVKGSAALVVGNLARTDENCKALVQSGVVPLLINLAHWKGDEEMCCKIHTASLAALRNLSILESNRLSFLHSGVVDTAIEALCSPAATVQFNALGVLRLASTKQVEVCRHIAMSKGTLIKLCELVGQSGFSHIQLEGGRLLASIVKYSSSTEVVKEVAVCGGTRCIAALLEAAPLVIKNEGVIALSLMATVQDSQVTETFVSQNTLGLIIPLLRDESPELASNSLVLLNSLLATSDVLARKMKESDGYLTVLEGLKDHTSSEVASKAQLLLQQLNTSAQ
ncbi:hypothetical protein EMCRGX_G024364 [Ephydatia muelleri]|eukprot:Em0015g553a